MKPEDATRRFSNHFYETSLRYTFEETKKMNYHCETFLVGSDQLWNWYSTKDMGQYFFLDFADDKHKRIAYATSFGHAQSFFYGEEKLKVAYNLKKFDAVSVREKDGVKICEEEFGVIAEHTLDPVFLCPSESYENAINLSAQGYAGKYLLAYILNPTEEKYEVIKKKALQLGIDYKIILDAQAEKPVENKKVFHNDSNILEKIEIADWLWLFKNSEFIVTDSYHGFCFSIIFHKQFICFLNKLRGNSRFNSLAELLDVKDFLINDAIDIQKRDLEQRKVDYCSIEKRLDDERNRSLQWLKAALEMPKKNISADTLLYEELFDIKKDIEDITRKYNEANDTKKIEKILSDKKEISCPFDLSLFKKFVICIKTEGLKVAWNKSMCKIREYIKNMK